MTPYDYMEDEALVSEAIDLVKTGLRQMGKAGLQRLDAWLSEGKPVLLDGAVSSTRLRTNPPDGRAVLF
jgi:hypothetical protein